MKHIITIFIIIFILIVRSADCTAQKGQDYFKNQEYALAVKEYEKELKKAKNKAEQARIEAQIGMSYYYMNNPREASSWLKKAMSHGFNTADGYCIYGLSLQKQENYSEALDAFNQCLKANRRYPNIDLYIQSCNYAIAHPEPNEHIVLRSSKINTNGSEYGISPCANGDIFFTRAPVKGRIDPRTGLAYAEVFVTKLENNDLAKPKKEKAFMKAYYNTGVFTYDAVTNQIYMTVCDPKGKCGIYKSKYNRSNWEKPESFLVNDSYDMAHPAISKDGNRLYFTSNAPGGMGKTDIWYVERAGGDRWGTPVNAGNTINTAGRDEFPFIDGETNTLYFASDGHPGFGGLDIFAAVIDGNQIDSAKNLGRPFNSGADDFNLVTSGEKGLMVSSRNIRNSDDIYIFNRTDIPGAKRVEKEPEPEPEPQPVVEPTPEPEPQPIIESKPEPVIVVPESKPVSAPRTNFAVIYFDFNRFVPQRDYRNYDDIVAQMKAYPNATFEVAGYTDPRGGKEFNAELSDKRAEYIAKRLTDRGIPKNNIVIKGYGFNDPAVPDASTEEGFQKNRRVEIRIIKTSN